MSPSTYALQWSRQSRVLTFWKMHSKCKTCDAEHGLVTTSDKNQHGNSSRQMEVWKTGHIDWLNHLPSMALSLVPSCVCIILCKFSPNVKEHFHTEMLGAEQNDLGVLSGSHSKCIVCSWRGPLQSLRDVSFVSPLYIVLYERHKALKYNKEETSKFAIPILAKAT